MDEDKEIMRLIENKVNKYKNNEITATEAVDEIQNIIFDSNSSK
jgi:hypothetical protein